MNPRTGLFLAPLAALAFSSCAASPATPSPTAAAPSAAASQGSATYTMAEVAKHTARDDCWAAIDGHVYNLTSWIAQHPGGPDKIIGLCGTDATAKFRGQHDSQERPNAKLLTFRVGTLAR